MSIEERLRKIMQKPQKDWDGCTMMIFPTTTLLGKIIQAFKDDGWAPIKLTALLRDEKLVKTMQDAGYKVSESITAEYMTGQEWYERFEKEMTQYMLDCDYILAENASDVNSYNNKNVTRSLINSAREAAKRASGIEDSND
jgi:hypothetical protein